LGVKRSGALLGGLRPGAKGPLLAFAKPQPDCHTATNANEDREHNR
jgi:hypothetical protein